MDRNSVVDEERERRTMEQVVHSAWSASGCPTVLRPTGFGDCGRCGASGADLVATGAVVSRTFTAFDGWINPHSWGLCAACSWAYRGKGLRTCIGLVTREPSWRQLSCATAREVLAVALPSDAALIVPLRGRKHLLPSASWGRVSVDDVQLSWTERDAGRLHAVQRLRAQGFGPKMLSAAAPAWAVLRRLPAQSWDVVVADWEVLAVWRRNRPWFDVAMSVTSRGNQW